jgi:hypothetical protein
MHIAMTRARVMPVLLSDALPLPLLGMMSRMGLKTQEPISVDQLTALIS